MSIKYKGIYVMSANKELVSNDQNSQLVRQGLQHLTNSNNFFKLLWIQARTEGPKFHEGMQQIQQQNQPFDVIVANFKEWLHKSGVTVEENQWDSYFFSTTTPDPNATDWKRHILVFFHTSGVFVLESSSFIVDYTTAGKLGNATRLMQLFNLAVHCPACEKVVDPALRASKNGFLSCPFCGQWWTKPLK